MGVFGVSCGSNDSTESENSTSNIENVTVRVGLTADNSMMLLRESTSAFEDTPYDIEWVKLESSSAVLEAVASGAVDFAGVLQAPSLLLSQGNADPQWDADSAPFRAVAIWEGRNDPGFSLIVSDPQISEISQLSGRKLAVSRGSLGHYFWLAAAESAGVDDVELVLLPPSEGRAAFQSGAVDALVSSHKATSSMVKQGEGTIIDSSNRIVPTTYLSVMSSEALQSEGIVSAVEDFLGRMETAVQMTIDDPQPVLEFLQRAFEFSEEDAKDFATLDVLVRVSFDDERLTLLNQIADVFLANDVIANEVDPDIIIDRRFDPNSDQ